MFLFVPRPRACLPVPPNRIFHKLDAGFHRGRIWQSHEICSGEWKAPHSSSEGQPADLWGRSDPRRTIKGVMEAYCHSVRGSGYSLQVHDARREGKTR